ncbi:MAG: ABC transporter permease [Sphingobacterium sp.]|nr:ABC transporter permease [Sphingobacterium sp.]
MNKIIRYVFVDLLRNKTILCYTILLFVLSMTVYSMEDNYEKGLLSLLNIVLFVVPLMSIVFSGIYIYQSSEFINCLVSQPLQRKSIWGSLYVGLAGALSLAFFIGVGIPTFIYAFSSSGITLVGCGLLLSLIFVSIAMWTSVLIRDKSKGIGLAILLWLYFTLLFDALVLFILFQFADYPIEHGMVALSMLNPIDICRILILLQVDLSAMMGYTGAIFRDFFGNTFGIAITLLVMLLWCLIPLGLSIRYFKKKDL